MASFTVGKVRVENGLATVRANWETGLVSVTDNFSGGEVVDWHNDGDTGTAADGSGVAISWNSLSKELIFYRTSGDNPIEAAVIVGATSGAEGTIDSFGTGSPPRFDLNISGGDFFTVKSLLSVYQVAGSGILADQFNLTSAYSDSTNNRTEYAVTGDFTTNRGYPLAQLGDTNPLASINDSIEKIDSDMANALAGGGASLGSLQTPSLGAKWENYGAPMAGAGYALGVGIVHTEGVIKVAAGQTAVAGDVIFTYAVGWRPNAREIFFSGIERLDVKSNGELVFMGESGFQGWLSLASIRFRQVN